MVQMNVATQVKVQSEFFIILIEYHFIYMQSGPRLKISRVGSQQTNNRKCFVGAMSHVLGD
ncbi:uncharacterized protein DS421_13g431230 [Arachis hypogaea]|nr:uncharacterized protein DS421_13g431230 [Arachis hypogaea]